MENCGKMLTGLKFIDTEYRLYPAYNTLQADFYNPIKPISSKTIGRIDLIFVFRGRKYIGEIKWMPESCNNLWDTLKVLGYCEYYKFQNQLTLEDNKVYPAILMPTKKIRLEEKIVAGRLKIALFGIEKKGEDYKITPINL